MRAKAIALLLLSVLCLACVLSACGGIRAGESLPDGAERMETQRSIPKPSPLPEPAFEPGGPVFVNGTELSESYVLDGVCYIGLRAFCCALELELEADGREFLFRRRGTDVEGRLGSDVLIVDSELLPLEAEPLLYGGELYVPACSFCETLRIGTFRDEENDAWYFTPGAGDWPIPAGYAVPALMYHGVSDRPWGNTILFVSPSELEQQLLFLLEAGYEPIWFEDLEHVDQFEKPILLTFDDGYVDNYTELFPLLLKYQVKATIFIVTDWNGGLYLDEEMIREMSDSGLISIQSHTMSHRRLSELDDEPLERQLSGSQLAITRLTGKQPFVLCYPEGAADGRTAEFVEEYYRFGVMMAGRRYITGDDPLWVYRTFVGRGMSTAYLKILLDL